MSMRLDCVAVVSMLGMTACGPELEARMGVEPVPAGPSLAGVFELAHRVELRFDHHQARLWVRREFRNDSEGVQELAQTLSIPDSGVVRSFRIHHQGQWVEGRLQTADAANQRYGQLTHAEEGLGEGQVAMLSWADAEQLFLQAYPVGPQEDLIAEYEVLAPLEYQSGQWHFSYPYAKAPESAKPEVTWVGPVRAEDVSFSEQGELDSEEAALHFQMARSPIEVWAARWGVRPVAPDQQLWGLQLDLAEELAPVPRGAQVVFVLDASCSQGEAGLERQLGLLEGYLAHLPDASVELVTYRRRAEAAFGAFVPAAEVLPRWRALPPQKRALGNGSNLDQGARLAAELLNARVGPRRMVLLTDDLLRSGFSGLTLDQALVALAPDAIPHLVRLRGEAWVEEEERLEDHPLVPAMEARGGMAVGLEVSSQPNWPQLAAGLVRPIRLDRVWVEAVGMERDRIETDEQLEAGASVRRLAMGQKVPSSVTLHGWLWGRRISKTLFADGALYDELPGLALHELQVREELSSSVIQALGLEQGMLTPETSFLAERPGRMPTRAPWHLGVKGWASHAYAFGCRAGAAGLERPDSRALWHHQLTLKLEAARRQCGAPGPVAMTVDTTLNEIVAVAVDGEGKTAECLTEQAWRWALPPSFDAQRVTFHLRVD